MRAASNNGMQPDGAPNFFFGGSSMNAEANRCPKCNGEMVQGFTF